MPNFRDPETLLIRREEEAARKRQAPPPRRWPSSPRAAAPKMHVPPPPTLSPVPVKVPPFGLPGTLSAKRLKVTLVLDAAELLAIPAPDGRPRAALRIGLPGRFVTAEIAAKSLRKAQTTVREVGADNVALVLQGRLTAVRAGKGAKTADEMTRLVTQHEDARRERE